MRSTSRSRFARSPRPPVSTPTRPWSSSPRSSRHVRNVYVIGAGMTRFEKSDRSLKELVVEAVSQALADSSAAPGDLHAAYVGNAVAGLLTGQEMIRGQVLLRA